MNIHEIDFSIKNESSGTLSFQERSFENEILQLDINLHFDEPTAPQAVEISFVLPAHGIASVFSPYHNLFHPHPEWSPTVNESRLSGSSPVIHCTGYDDINRYTVALSDVQTPIRMAAGIVEETAEMRFTITLFSSLVAPLCDYNAVLYIDMRRIPYYDALHDLEVYWQAFNDLTPCPVPEDALHPLYSFWYSYHQKFTTEEILSECRLAKQYGMKTVILDDGWQTEDNSRGYAYCGDWEIAHGKIPDIRALTDGVHAMGMKILFWFSVPFIGKYAKCFSDFEGMYLNGGDWRCLDPRFPKVREFLIDKWVRAMKEWNLDGLKLDFIDSMKLTDISPVNDPRMDETSLEKGIEKLLKQAYDAITAIRPDALIEFRQAYIGPTMQAYGNILRVTDCPEDAHSNRVRSMLLRLLTHSTAIHSDMLMWNKDESAASAARQITAILFTVPQISVKLNEISEEQKQMLRFYLSLWKAHRQVLLFGDIIPHSPDCHFPLIEAIDENEHFAVSYTKGILEIDQSKTITYVNATEGDALYIHFKAPLGARTYRIYDATGKLVKEAHGAMKGLRAFQVPSSGVLEIL